MLRRPFDARRDLAIGATTQEAIAFAVQHWIDAAHSAIRQRGRFAVALSGGSTPNAIYQALAHAPHPPDWSKVLLFWSDERAVPPDHPDSNYGSALRHGLSALPITQIFRMQAERHPLKEAAADYQNLIQKHLGPHLFDLVMLGVGEDGHTASLFPNTAALDIQDQLVAANWIPQKNCWRMTLTYPCIQTSRAIALYALGASKTTIVPQVLRASLPSPFPASSIGTEGTKALWILDNEAAKEL